MKIARELFKDSVADVAHKQNALNEAQTQLEGAKTVLQELGKEAEQLKGCKGSKCKCIDRKCVNLEILDDFAKNKKTLENLSRTLPKVPPPSPPGAPPSPPGPRPPEAQNKADAATAAQQKYDKQNRQLMKAVEAVRAKDTAYHDAWAISKKKVTAFNKKCVPNMPKGCSQMKQDATAAQDHTATLLTEKHIAQKDLDSKQTKADELKAQAVTAKQEPYHRLHPDPN